LRTRDTAFDVSDFESRLVIRPLRNEDFDAIVALQERDIHYSQCGIFTPSDVGFARDAIAAESTPNIETLLTHEVDVELLRRARHHGTVRTWADRRTDLYAIEYRGPHGSSRKA
jgi:hypothetical protein